MSGRKASKKTVVDDGLQRRKAKVEEDRKKKRKEILQKKRSGAYDDEELLDDPIYSKYIEEQVDMDDKRYECLLDSRKIKLKNLHANTTKSDILSFFENKASIKKVNLEKSEDNNTRTCVLVMEKLSETRKVLKMKGELIRVQAEDLACPIFIARLLNHRKTLFVSNFKQGMEKDAIKRELQKTFGRNARIMGIYLPPDNVGFCYILVENCRGNIKRYLSRGSIKTKDGQDIIIREAFLVPEILDLLKSS